MKNISSWQETKFTLRKGKLVASSNESFVYPASRLMVNCIAKFYDTTISSYAKGHLLDLGCGAVPLYGVYNHLSDTITCVDWEGSMHHNKHLDVVADLNNDLPLENSTYDTIILSDVLEHIKKPRQLWDEMYRVLKRDGHLLMNVPFYYQIHEEPYDYYRYTKYALIDFAEEAGFELKEIYPIGGAPEILADIISKHVMKVPGVGKFLVKIIQASIWWLVQRNWGKKWSIHSSQKFPFGYALVAVKK